jgi:tripeptidyl-peptidase I
VLLAVSDPDSHAYGHFLSAEQVDALVAPSPDRVARVAAWLQGAGQGEGVVSTTRNGDFLHVDTTVGRAEKLLGHGAEYLTYHHAATGKTITRLRLSGPPSASEEEEEGGGAAAPYTLPEGIAPLVDFVAPTVTFPPVDATTPFRVASPQAKPVITPPKLRALANMTDADVGKGGSAATGKGAIKQGVASFLGQFYDPADLKALRAKYDLSTAGLDKLLVGVPAAQKHAPVGVEASMDVQYITSTGNEIVTEHWSTAGAQPGNPENEPFVKWLTDVASAGDDVPSLFSISYGDEETGVSYAYAQRCAVEFQKAGVRGISLLAASGDAGVGCGTAGFIPTFPASCPYVTGVGAVTGGTPGQSPTGEGVADLSGGGFSNYFARPSYQDDAVKAYVSRGGGSGLPEQDKWNASGAGFPDIAAQGILFDVCTENFFYPYSGTSAACPSATGVLSMLSQDRLDRNMTRLGWLNPLLYKIGAGDADRHAFNDVTDGTNTCCGDDTGFSAAKGWDPVSGWGTLNYGKMKAPMLAAGAARAEERGDEKTRTVKYGRGYKFSAAASSAFLTRSTPHGATFPYQQAAARAGGVADAVDWRAKGAVSQVRNQGQGETCWAFSTAGSVEGAMVAVGGADAIEPLSPQYLEDCMDIPCANSSGTPDNAFAWIAAHHGGSVYSYTSYPYLDSDCIFWDPPRTCLSNGTLSPNTVKTPVVGYHHTIVSNETDLMLAVAQQPVSIAVFSSLGTFTTYTGGVYYDKGCEDVTSDMLDHAVLLVGYGTDDATKEPYWLVKNSWGPKWGENGYIRMRRNVRSDSGLCGLAIDASFPNVKKKKTAAKAVAAVAAAAVVDGRMPAVLPSRDRLTAGAAAKNFTQYVCKGPDALGNCENDLSKCDGTTHEQGACLHTKSGHSLRARCGTEGSVNFELFETTANCTGAVTKIQQLEDTCQQGGGGAYFVKLECEQ